MTKIQLEIDDTNLYNALRGIINHANGDEIAKALAHSIGCSPTASGIFFKTYLGDIAPAVLPQGTIIKIYVSALIYKAQIEKMKEKGLIDEAGNCTAIIKEFRGFHENSTYYISYTNVRDDGTTYQDTGFINYKDIISVVEEF